jgi:hypothetical protein
VHDLCRTITNQQSAAAAAIANQQFSIQTLSNRQFPINQQSAIANQQFSIQTLK